ncbi:hypothetical protein [Streptomyces sp. NBC_00620]|uniref:hypothetical protein n=1 Tax=Streptomyces sp. NBC_00620 TaxID=2903666 RepID=UPI00225B051D|nr:hypothetical protein [Streptomyces sp. NBC_00620]MCX4977144.1 hypothetical protein [Streptomyces sp. NBC_00620]
MLASWYDEQGPAADVLHVGELPDPKPGPGEVRIRVSVSGLNPGDTKKRRGWLGSSMPCTASYPTIRPSGCPATSATNWARASAFPESPPTARCSRTARSTGGSCSCTERSAASAPWRLNSPAGAAPP